MMVSHEPRMHRPNAREGRDLERPPPARDLVVDRTVHKTPNIFPVAYSHPTPSGVREAFMPGRDREVEGSHAQSASRSTRGRSAKIRASVVTTLFFLCVFFFFVYRGRSRGNVASSSSPIARDRDRVSHGGNAPIRVRVSRGVFLSNPRRRRMHAHVRTKGREMS